MRKIVTSLALMTLVIFGMPAAAEASDVPVLTPTVIADTDPYQETIEMTNPMELNGTIYFVGSTARYGNELMRINGNGEIELAYDVRPTGSSYPQLLTNFNNKIYFIGTTETGGRELYSYSPSTGLTDILQICDSYPYLSLSMQVFNNRLYFFRYMPNGESRTWELWTNDGVSSTKVNLPGSTPNVYMGDQAFYVFGNKMYFTAPNNDGGDQNSLAVVGTSGPVTIAPNTETVANPYGFASNGSKLFFRGTGDDGRELYAYDGANAPILFDIVSGGNSSNPSNLVTYKNLVYFTADDANGKRTVFSSDGVNSPVAVTLPAVADLPWAGPYGLVVFNNRLYVTIGGVIGHEDYSLEYSYDGTSLRQETAFESVASWNNLVPVVLQNRMYTLSLFGDRYFPSSFDGTTVKPIFSAIDGTAPGYFEMWSGSGFATTSDALYFASYSYPELGLRRYNGTSAPTMVPGSAGYWFSGAISVGNTIYVVGQPDGFMQPTHFFKYSGTGSLQPLTNLDSMFSSNTPSMDVMNGGVLFSTSDKLAYLKNDVLTSTDVSVSSVSNVTVIGNKVYFTADGADGHAIYSWNGSGAVTTHNTVNGNGYQVSKLLPISGELYVLGSLSGGVNGLYRVTDSTVEIIDTMDNYTYYGMQSAVIGNATFAISTVSGGSQSIIKATSSGHTFINTLNDVTLWYNGVYAVNGVLNVSVMLKNGEGAIFELDASGNVLSRINIRTRGEGEGAGYVAAFNGQRYFGYLSPDYGYELATDGSVFSSTVPGAPTSLAKGTVTDKSVELTWHAPASDGNQPVSTYLVEYSRNGSTWTPFRHFTSSATSLTVTGLSFNTSYQFRVKASNMKGNSSASSVLTVKTKVVKPSLPRNIKVAAAKITKVSAVVTWSAPATLGSGRITDYKVETSKDGKKWTAVKHTASPALKITIKSLKTKTKYYVRVTAISTAGNSAASAKVAFKTK